VLEHILCASRASTGLCGGRRVTVVPTATRTRKVVNRATVAFRNAASTLLKSQSYLGAQYRRLRTRLGAPKAITAMARKLACLFYRLIKHGQPYIDKGTEYYEARYREQQIRSLTKRAQKLGLQVVVPQTT